MRGNILFILVISFALSACGGGSNNWVPNSSTSSSNELTYSSSDASGSSASTDSNVSEHSSASSIYVVSNSSLNSSEISSENSSNQSVIPLASSSSSSDNNSLISSSGYIIPESSSSQNSDSYSSSTSSLQYLSSSESTNGDSSVASSANFSSVFSSWPSSATLSSSESSTSSSVNSSALASAGSSELSSSSVGVSSSESFYSSYSTASSVISSSSSSIESSETSASESSDLSSSVESSASSASDSSNSNSSSTSSSMPYFNNYIQNKPYRASTTLPDYEDMLIHGTIAQKAHNGIYVNGIFFNHTSAGKIKNGLYIPSEQLEVGDEVVMTGYLLSQTTANALMIVIEADLIGQVKSVDSAHGTVTALGQTIALTDRTLWPDNNFKSMIDVGDYIEVVGDYTDESIINASRISLTPDHTSFIKGVLAVVDDQEEYMIVGNTKVDFSNYQIQDPDSYSGESIVAARGSYIYDKIVPDTNSLNISKSDSHMNTELAEVAIVISGEVHEKRYSNLAMIGDHRIVLQHESFAPGFPLVENGSVDSIVPGKHITVFGYYDGKSSLYLIPTKIVIRDDYVGTLRSVLVDSVLPNGSTSGTIFSDGVAYTVNAETKFIDSSYDEVEFISISTIGPGDTIDISFSTSSQGERIALDIMRISLAP